MSAARDPLSKHVRPRLTEERVSQQYAAIAARLPQRARLRFAAPLGFALAGALAAVVLIFTLRHGGPTTTLADGTWLESAPAGTPPAVTLADGSHVALGAKSRLRLTSTRADSVRLDLERGRVDVEATHATGRTFVVAARDVEVFVVGTRFSVSADGAVRVHVDEGRVRVHSPAGDRFVSGGEEWVADEGATQGNADVDAAAAAAPATDDATDVRLDGGFSPPWPRVTHITALTAKDLLDDAQKALAQGRTRDAAKALETIGKRFSRDPRAGLAAFELGRIRLDSLGDAAGAEEAFREAMRLARDGSLRDDAEAARVEALDRMGSRDACVRARDGYLQHRPRGVHRADVATRCGGT
jgi:transmembrane sensor